MTRIDHTGHNHPNTTKARTACRKLNRPVGVGDMVIVHLNDANSDKLAEIIEVVGDHQLYVRMPSGFVSLVFRTRVRRS